MPLTFAFDQKSEIGSAREPRQLDYVRQLISDIKYVPGRDKVVAEIKRFCNSFPESYFSDLLWEKMWVTGSLSAWFVRNPRPLN